MKMNEANDMAMILGPIIREIDGDGYWRPTMIYSGPFRNIIDVNEWGGDAKLIELGYTLIDDEKQWQVMMLLR